MSNITLTAGIRQNLLSLQQTSADLTTTQEALSTGNKVNSASDNPSAYFTSQNLTNNANALSSLLDQIGQGQQTINAATNGLTGLTSLLQQALSTAQQAQQASSGTLSYTAITGNATIVPDTTQVTSTNNLTQALAVTGTNQIQASSQSTVSVSAAAITALQNAAAQSPSSIGQTLTFKLGNDQTVTATFGASNNTATNTFNTAAGLAAVLNSGAGTSGNLNGEAVAATSSGAVTVTSDDLVNNFAAVGGTATTAQVGTGGTVDASTQTAVVSNTVGVHASQTLTSAGLAALTSGAPGDDSDTLVFQLGTGAAVTATFGSSDSTATNTFTDAAGLIAVLNHGVGGNLGATATAASNGAGGVTITSADYTNDFQTVTGSGASTVSADLSQVAHTAPVDSTATVDQTALTALTNGGPADYGQTLTFQLGSGSTVTATFGAANSTATNTFNTAAGLVAVLNNGVGPSGSFNGSATAAVSGNNVVLTANTDTSAFAAIAGTATTNHYATSVTSGDLSQADLSTGSTLTVADGNGHTATLYYVAGNASAANGTFSSTGGIASALADSNLASYITGGGSNSDPLTLTSDSSITVGGTIGAAFGFGTTTVDDNYNATLANLANTTLSVQVGSDAAHTLSFGTGGGQISTLAQLNTALSSWTDVNASVSGSGKLTLTPTGSESITIGGTSSTASTLLQGTGSNTPQSTVVSASSTRTTLQENYNSLLTQIDQLASDSSYNGVNLLNSDNLIVDFDPNGSSSLTIAGVNDSSTGLGLSQLSNDEFQNDNTISNIVTNINSAISTVQAQTETFGTNSGVITTRQTFETNMINTLQTGASNLVAADQNEESADLLTEQTQQQLEISALSIANQANQSVLKLFG